MVRPLRPFIRRRSQSLAVGAQTGPFAGSCLVLPSAASKPVLQSLQSDRARIGSESALPHNGDSPPGFEEVAFRTAVPLHVAIELGLPELRSCRWGGRVGASRMAMPKAAVNEANRAVATEDKIRCSRETPYMESESKPPRVERPSNDEFGLRVLRRYARHHARSRGPVHDVGHQLGGPFVQPVRTHDFTRGCHREQEEARRRDVGTRDFDERPGQTSTERRSVSGATPRTEGRPLL